MNDDRHKIRGNLYWLSYVIKETSIADCYMVRSPHNYSSIQAFRFIAAIMVIICHSSFYTFERLTKATYIYREGANGVDLFFVISGFVMIVSSDRLLKTASGWKIFAFKRLIRIVPVYWLITTFKLLLMLIAAGFVYHSRLDIGLILKSYFFIPALNIDGEFRPLYGVGWTLNLEMFFYLLFALSLALKIRPIPFLALIFVPLACLSFYKTAYWPDISFYADSIVLNFLYGMIAAKLIMKGKKLPANISMGLILLGLLYLFLPRAGLFESFDENKLWIGLASFLIIYSAASIDDLIASKIPVWLVNAGGASYSLYLIHPSVAPLIPTLLNHVHLKTSSISIALSVTVAIFAGLIFYKYVEKQITRFFTKGSSCFLR